MCDLPVPKRVKRSGTKCERQDCLLVPERAQATSCSARNNILPDPAVHKAEYETLKSHLEGLTAIDICALSPKRLLKLSDDQKLSCLILKYGYKAVSTCAASLTRLPTSLPQSHLLKVISQQTSLPTSDVATLCRMLREHCSSLLISAMWPSVNLPNMMAPSVNECMQCGSNLTPYHSCDVTCYTLTGPSKFTKVTLRCQGCKILYNYSQLGDKNATGFRFYPNQQEYVEVTDTVFYERGLLEFQCSLA